MFHKLSVGQKQSCRCPGIVLPERFVLLRDWRPVKHRLHSPWVISIASLCICKRGYFRKLNKRSIKDPWKVIEQLQLRNPMYTEEGSHRRWSITPGHFMLHGEGHRRGGIAVRRQLALSICRMNITLLLVRTDHESDLTDLLQLAPLR